MKKLIPDEKNWKNKLTKFFNNKGFYIVLAVCILIVAATAIYVATQNMNSPDTSLNDPAQLIPGEANLEDESGEQAKAVAGSVSNTDIANQSTVAEQSTPANATASAPEKDNEKANDKANEETSPKAKSDNAAVKSTLKFDRPVDGAIMKDFTRDVTTFSESKTLGDIRAHKGLDFKVEKLTKVRAVADGTISLVEDNANGITVEISHGTDGLVTKYAGLSRQGLEDICCGLKVKANEIIGLVGDPIQSECEDGAHLHFEVLKNGKSVDPVPYLRSTSEKTDKEK
ncbi:M23 family metallopeptidase [Ruminiclostridium herbifermentans]|uniref:M23 family metallopeptidase n=1 Tax=Ruminiclostridium herbifermentans TaxID=2488810 RepID=A0A4U7JG61_9FIRM|nr:M23 family metallopeptidase [Ruminiclostridium herbifermentans]QNU66640.1 M23 family metallopeptidase [Ruminiclostridium herbifermentans]